MGKNIIKFWDKSYEDNYLSTNSLNKEHIVYKTELENGYSVGYDSNKLKLNQIPLTFKMHEGGWISWNYDVKNGVSLPKTIEYRKNGGPWTSITSNTSGTHIYADKGDIVQFRGDNPNYAISSGSYAPNNHLKSSGNYDVYGNLMSLVNSTNFENLTTSDIGYAFAYFFNNDTHLINAKDLILPIKNVADNAYMGMFNGCRNLKTAPALPATTVDNSYTWMFMGCTSLTDTPELRIQNINHDIGSYMFDSCSSITRFSCISPTIGGIYMFESCSKLNYIRAIGSQGSTTNWTNGVASTGTFIKSAGITWTSGASGIPTGWTVYSEISKDCNALTIRNYLNSQTTLSVKDVGQCTVTKTDSSGIYQYDIRKSGDNSLVASFKIKSNTWAEIPTETILIEESV